MKGGKTFKVFNVHISKLLAIFKNYTMHVRISDKGREVINDKVLAAKLLKAILEHKKELDTGDAVKVDNYSVRSVTSIKEAKPSE